MERHVVAIKRIQILMQSKARYLVVPRMHLKARASNPTDTYDDVLRVTLLSVL
jgi:hypothetical protein